jgi:ankyrin repeat protein
MLLGCRRASNSTGLLLAMRGLTTTPSNAVQGFTHLHLAAQEGAVEAASPLLERGASVDRANVFGNTALFTAVYNRRGDGAVIELLRRDGADPRGANVIGRTPLGLARLIATTT